MECDSKAWVDCVNCRIKSEQYCGIIAGDIQDLLVEVEGNSIIYIPQQANQVAHKIAHGPDLISIWHMREHIVSLIPK